MSFPNRENVFQYTSELSTGWFKKPHGLIALLKDGRLTKSEYLLLDFLMSFENRMSKRGQVFFCSDKEIIATGLLSSKNVVKARYALRGKGFLDFKKGHSHHATDYLILIPAECFREREEILT